MKYLALLLAVALSPAFAADVAPSTIDVKAASGVTLKITPRAGNTSKVIPLSPNAHDTINHNGQHVYPPYCDPITNLPKGCVVKPPPTDPAPHPTMYPGYQVDLSKVPATALSKGTMEMRVRPTTEIAPLANGKPGMAGAFRTTCDLVAYTPNDPVAALGMVDLAHMHTVVGNPSFNANSTLASLMAAPSACRGGIANRSPYWVSTLIDIRTLAPLPFDGWATYYKGGVFDKQDYEWTGPDGVSHSVLNADGTKKFPGFTTPPNGLKVVAGDPMRKVPRTNSDEFSYRWQCITKGVNTYAAQIPVCPAGSTLYQEVYFPQCWDGKNLDSPNHKAHMAYPIVVRNVGDSRGWSHNECPATHPVVLPQISFQIHWDIKDVEGTKYLRLAQESDLSAPAGVGSHGDLFIAHDEKIKEAWMEECIRGGPSRNGKDCHSHLLGDGREIYGPP